MYAKDYESMKKYCENKGFFTFTDLQKRAFEQIEFWNNEQDVFVIGATSSGKTLIANAAMLIEKNGRKQNVLYLVPYKALALQKKEELEEFFGKTYKISLSTSEYRENDRLIIVGNTDIAVMIYEKAFLFQNLYSEFLNSYDLIIFDEFGIVDSEERGIKADILLTWSKKIKGLRTIVLTTPNYNWETYANKERFLVIESEQRPTKLEETFLVRKKKYTITNGEKNFYWEISKIGNDSCEIPFEDENQTLENVMTSICRYHWIKKHKILIFVNNREEVKRKAEQIYKRLVKEKLCIEPKREQLLKYKDEFLKDIDLEEDDLYSVFEDKSYAMMENGVTFHSAAMPAELRRKIEYEILSDKGNLRIVVATETLAYVLNSNVDVVIIKPNNEGRGKKMLSQNEYFNYIGRAGRFMKNSKGYAYTIIPERVYDEWLDVYTQVKDKLESHLYQLDEKRAAFYFLSIFSQDRIAINIQYMKEFIEEIPHFQEKPNFSIEKILRLLEKAQLIRIADDTFEEEYYITNKGIKVRGYIVGMDTYWKLTDLIEYVLNDTKFHVYDYLYYISECKELVDEASQQFAGKKSKNIKNIVKSIEQMREGMLERGDLSYRLNRIISNDSIISKAKLGKWLSFEEQKKIVQLRISMILYMRIYGHRISDIYNVCIVPYGSIQTVAEEASFLLDTLIAIGYKKLVINEMKVKFQNLSIGLFMGINLEVFEFLEDINVDINNRTTIKKIADCVRLINEIENEKRSSWSMLKRIALEDKKKMLDEKYQRRIEERVQYVYDKKIRGHDYKRR